MNYFNKVKNYVIKIHTEIGREKSLPHFERTVYWLKELNPDADEALLISAFGHDIERAFSKSGNMNDVINSKDGYMNKDLLERHQNKGGEIIAKFLRTLNAPEDMIERVQHLISKHEVGGDDDQNLLKDADSLSYFETNADNFLEKHIPLTGKEKVRDKFQWMFDRITSAKAKSIIEPKYKEVMEKLENL